MAKRLKLYTCCTNAKCAGYQELLDFLRLWGLEVKLESDKGGSYFDVTPPDHWLDNRRKRFAAALNGRRVPEH